MPWRIREPRMKNPRGGWRWTELGVEITESTPNELADHIARMRRANDLPVGEPMDEIAAHLSATDPWMVRYEPENKQEAPKKDPLTDRVERWTFDRVREPAQFIHQFDAKQRAAVCHNCLFNRGLKHNSEEESARYWKSLMIASRGKCASPEADGLRVCALYGHDNRLAVWLESPHTEAKCCENDEKKPKNCWI